MWPAMAKCDQEPANLHVKCAFYGETPDTNLRRHFYECAGASLCAEHTETRSIKRRPYAVSVCAKLKIISDSEREHKNLSKMLSHWSRGFFDEYDKLR